VKKHFRVRYDEDPFQHQTHSQMPLSKLAFPAKIHTQTEEIKNRSYKPSPKSSDRKSRINESRKRSAQ
jgi:hypothetical protein